MRILIINLLFLFVTINFGHPPTGKRKIQKESGQQTWQQFHELQGENTGININFGGNNETLGFPIQNIQTYTNNNNVLTNGIFYLILIIYF
jgi:hypothetical protein